MGSSSVKDSKSGDIKIWWGDPSPHPGFDDTLSPYNINYIKKMGVFMEILKTIRERRSIRRFERRDIPPGDLERIMEAAIWAPSAGNLQSRKFIIVKNPKLKDLLAEAAYRQIFIKEAPIVIVACADLERSALGYGERGRNLYCLFDVAASIENMLLTIHELGLGACWVGAFDEKLVAEILEIKSTLRPVTLLPVGYPAEEPSPPPRVGLEEAFTIID